MVLKSNKVLGDGGYPTFIWAKLTPSFFAKSILINKDKSRLKVFVPFDDVSKPSPFKNTMIISYGCIYKKIINFARIENLAEARNEYKNY